MTRCRGSSVRSNHVLRAVVSAFAAGPVLAACCHVTARLEGEGRLGRGGRQPERETSRRSTAEPVRSNGLSAFWGGRRAGSAGEPTSLGSCSSRLKRPLRRFEHLLPARRRVAEGHESVRASGAVSCGDTDRASTRRRRNDCCETRSGFCSHERSPHRPTAPREALRRRDHARLHALGRTLSGVIDHSVRHADRLCLRSERLRYPCICAAPRRPARCWRGSRFRLDAGVPVEAHEAAAPDDEQARRPRLLLLDKGSPLRCQHDAHGSPGGRTRDQWVLPAIRATTHVDGKPIRSSRRARRGAGCWLRRTIGASGRTPMLSGRMTWRRASAARRPLIGSACPDGRRGGGGVRSGTLRTITRCSTAAAGVRPWSRSSARARAARSRVVRSGRRLGPVETPAYQRSSCAAAQGAFQPLLRFVQRASDRAIKRGARDDSFRQGAAVARWASTARPERSRAATTLAAACRGKASVIPLLGAMCRRPCRSARAPSWR